MGVCTFKRLRLALDLSPPLPLAAGVLEKWLAEPTRQIFLPASTFIANAKSYPVLPKGTQSFIRNIMKVGAYIRLSVVPLVVEHFSSCNPRSFFRGLTQANTVAVGRRLIPNISDTSRRLVQGCKRCRNRGLWKTLLLDTRITCRHRFRFVIVVFALFADCNQNRRYPALASSLSALGG